MSGHENATPRPWIVEPSHSGISAAVIYGGDNLEDLVMEIDWSDGDAVADAALIVEAVNAYDTLRAENEQYREALRRLRDATPTNTNSASARDAFGFVYAVAATALDEDRVAIFPESVS